MRKNLVFAAIIAATLAACTHQTAAGCEDAATISYQDEVQPILTANCAKSGCHSSDSKADGIDLSAYKGAAKIVKADDVSDSELYEVITSTGSNRMPPSINDSLSQSQISIVRTWIEQGAENTDCQ